MARNGSGTYSLPAGNPFVTGSVISSTTMNNTLSDIAAALTASVANDGQTPIVGNQNFGGYDLTNIGLLADVDQLGVGTASPAQIGHFVGTSATILVESTSGYSSILLQAQGTNPGYLFFYNGAGEQGRIQVNNSGAFVWQTGPSATAILQLANNGNLYPVIDNTAQLGNSTHRWTTVFATTGTINTSDARDKTAVMPFTADEIAASKALASEIGTFRFLSAIQDKGDEARRHVGMTVQRAIEIMEAHNLDPFAYGFICFDEWAAQPGQPEQEAQEAVFEDGKPVKAAAPFIPAVPAIEAGDKYGFRMDELLAFIARGFDARLAALESAA